MVTVTVHNSHLMVATFTYVSAFLITTVLHEFGHAVVSRLVGGTPTIYHVYVQHKLLPPHQRAAVAGAGPLFNLLQGVGCLLLFYSQSGLSGPSQLFLLWLATHGCANFFGYLITTPFLPNADLGIVSEHLNWSHGVQWLLVLLGLAAISWLGEVTREGLLLAVPISTVGLGSDALAELIFCYGVIPWLVGSVVIVIVSIPSPYLISFIYPPLGGIFVLLAWQGEYIPLSTPASQWADSALSLWLAITLGVLSLFRLLRRGFTF